ncbi:LytR/AlgR family response regulator transcription factor [Rufibacter quisquiliarum]|uniref:DNA-binding LytR/AlgR family response regulator n=1 Tax=Rufibacter quisquiliarum TaxID=1549639 RepID=A0A839GIA1_9BACT|nr:LytTR family DNA-binding domain-containing protein [Rufibacter quisquiliarum]MBA9079374.1 DNA-binding LytR/AlgR family response regulator [Rufibacter quisquiliarum]
MLTCLAIDDEPMALDVLRDYARMTPHLQLINTFDDGLKALAYLQTNKFDLLFLDINMPDLSGIQILKALRHPPMVIFTTAYSEYAVKSYELDAVDYLLKPIEFDRFLKAVNKAIELVQAKGPVSLPAAPAPAKEFLFLKSGHQMVKVLLGDILYIESDKNYSTFVLPHQKILSLMPLTEVQALLPAGQFFRIHKSYIVGLQHLQVIERHQVMVHGYSLPVGKVYGEAFFRLLNQGV